MTLKAILPSRFFSSRSTKFLVFDAYCVRLLAPNPLKASKSALYELVPFFSHYEELPEPRRLRDVTAGDARPRYRPPRRHARSRLHIVFF